jgi:hypothetical protein
LVVKGPRKYKNIKINKPKKVKDLLQILLSVFTFHSQMEILRSLKHEEHRDIYLALLLYASRLVNRKLGDEGSEYQNPKPSTKRIFNLQSACQASFIPVWWLDGFHRTNSGQGINNVTFLQRFETGNWMFRCRVPRGQMRRRRVEMTEFSVLRVNPLKEFHPKVWSVGNRSTSKG